MNIDARSLGAATAIVGVILWVVALIVDGPLVAVVLPILLVMGGGVLTTRGPDPRGGDDAAGRPDPRRAR